MSASLVGSEMCIRDSPPPAHPQCAPASRCTSRGQRHGSWPPAGPHLAATVSYTHLTLPTICSV
eukprot:11927888-Alexandrium_andersonii.AAC.1